MSNSPDIHTCACYSATSTSTLLAIMTYIISRPTSGAINDIDIDSADRLDHKYRYNIDIGKWDIDPPLVATLASLRPSNT